MTPLLSTPQQSSGLSIITITLHMRKSRPSDIKYLPQVAQLEDLKAELEKSGLS